MSTRFIWQFEIDLRDPIHFPLCGGEKEHLSWEARYFWEANEIITLHGLTSDFISLGNYRLKFTRDIYYLLPHTNQNIKKRQGKFFYKPLIEEKNGLCGYDKKVLLDDTSFKMTEIKDARSISVKKEVLRYALNTQPTIKLEIARLDIEGHILMTCCLQGRSYHLVDKLRNHLIKAKQTCHYIHFVKNILQ